MIVRPPQFWANPFGNPAEDYNVYVGVPNYSPRQEQYQLPITDGVDGPIVSNPFKVSKGLAKNANGELITPVINQQEYSLFFESPSGGGIEIAKFIGDGLSSEGGGSGGGIPDLTLNNLEQAQQTSLSSYNFVFIKSESSGWEGTASGPSIVSFYYRDGTTGTPSGGDEKKFFDLSGNGWSLAKTVTEKDLQTQIDQIEAREIEEKAATDQAQLDYTAPSDGLYEFTFMALASQSGPSTVRLGMAAAVGSPTGFVMGFDGSDNWGENAGVSSQYAAINGTTNDLFRSEGGAGTGNLGYYGTVAITMNEGDRVIFTHEAIGGSLISAHSSARKASS